MRAKVNLRVEILEGEDKGYVLEETNHIIELENNDNCPYYDRIKPYRIVLEFVTPDLLRRGYEREENNDNV